MRPRLPGIVELKSMLQNLTKLEQSAPRGAPADLRSGDPALVSVQRRRD
jgi:hypothetical protein